jgi:hypothetical protein
MSTEMTFRLSRSFWSDACNGTEKAKRQFILRSRTGNDLAWQIHGAMLFVTRGGMNETMEMANIFIQECPLSINGKRVS